MRIDAWFVSAIRVTDVSKLDLDRKKRFGLGNLLQDLSSYKISNLRFLLTMSKRRYKQK
jgi:hypothetical protein